MSKEGADLEKVGGGNEYEQNYMECSKDLIKLRKQCEFRIEYIGFFQV